MNEKKELDSFVNYLPTWWQKKLENDDQRRSNTGNYKKMLNAFSWAFSLRHRNRTVKEAGREQVHAIYTYRGI